MREQTGKGWVRRTIDRTDGPSTRSPNQLPTLGRPEAEVSGTFIGQGAEFEGILRLRGTFHIDTGFRGEIVSEASVIVEESAGIEASVRAREIIIRGAVSGDVHASRQLLLRSSGRLLGNVEAPCFEIEKGAVFNGQTTMVRPEVAARASHGNLLSRARFKALRPSSDRPSRSSTPAQPSAST